MKTLRNLSGTIANESGLNIDQKIARDRGTVRVILENVEYVIGPGATLTLQDRLIDMACAANSNLKVINIS